MPLCVFRGVRGPSRKRNKQKTIGDDDENVVAIRENQRGWSYYFIICVLLGISFFLNLKRYDSTPTPGEAPNPYPILVFEENSNIQVFSKPSFTNSYSFSSACNRSVELVTKFIWDSIVIYPQALGGLTVFKDVVYFKIPKGGSKFWREIFTEQFPGRIANLEQERKNYHLITFVREPTSRIFSAYGEIDANYNANAEELPHLSTPPNITFNKIPRNNRTEDMIRRFTYFINDIFSGNFLDDGFPSLRYWWPNHAYPMILPFLRYDRDLGWHPWTGHLEMVKSDWIDLQEKYEYLPDLPKSSKWENETTQDLPYNATLLKHLFNHPSNKDNIKRWVLEVKKRVKRNQKAMNTLCCNYLPDYVCFGYNLPVKMCDCEYFKVGEFLEGE